MKEHNKITIARLFSTQKKSLHFIKIFKKIFYNAIG
jgi:hypothetical protein